MVLNLASRIFLQIRAGTKKSKCLSHHFLVENGMIHQMAHGMFTLLPLGQRCVDKLARVVDAELRAVGAERLELPLLADAQLWRDSGRWEALGSELFRVEDRAGDAFCLQPTAEEAITKVMRDAISHPRATSFPILLYQCNQKFRDESNPNFGLLRSRQFLMNDLYSFDRDQRSAQTTYEMITDVYRRIFVDVLGLRDVRRVAADSGQIGGSVSHEFHMPNPSSEDQIRVCELCAIAHAKDINITPSSSATAANKNERQCQHKYRMVDTVEVSHTFQLGTHYSAALKALLATTRQPYFMCCFGLGITRLLAACIDQLSICETAMRLPYEISPFKLAFILPKEGAKDPRWDFAWSTINELEKMSNLRDEIFVDDRLERSVGRRLVDANRLGIPHIFVSNSMKTDDPFAVPTFEYLRAFAREDSLRKEGRVTHADVFHLAKSM